MHFSANTKLQQKKMCIFMKMAKLIYFRAKACLHSGLSNLSPEYFISSDVINERGTWAACATVCRCTIGVTNGCGLGDCEEE